MPIKITKHQEIVDDVEGETFVKIYGINPNWIKSDGAVTLTLPEARELLEALNEKIK